MNCVECDKPLVAIGNKRKNGKAGKKDWSNRKLHTECWKKQQENIKWQLLQERCKKTYNELVVNK
jgi:hypothetical protein